MKMQMQNQHTINAAEYTSAVVNLWHALERTSELLAKSAPIRYRASKRISDIARQGGAAGWQIEDLLAEMGTPWEISARWRDMARLAGVPVQTLLWRPSGSSDRTSGGEGLVLADLADLVIRLESWGIPVEPAELVTAALQTIKQKNLMTESELRVYWWKAERHRLRDLVHFQADMPAGARGVVSLPTGYRAASNSRGLVIAGPRIGVQRWQDTLLYSDYWHDNC